MLELQEVTKNFDGLMAVQDFSLNLAPGKITALIGPNGAGKSTLFNLITGFIALTSGKVFWQRKDLYRIPAHRIARMGIARTFQEVRLFRSLTVMENLTLAKRQGQYEGLWSSLFHRTAFQKLDYGHSQDLIESLESCHLSETAGNPASSLSYGQSKMVEILRASSTNSQLLLLDEPVAGLHPDMIDFVYDLLIKLVRTKGFTILLIEHNLPFVLRLADWVVVMDHGVKIAEDLPDKIKNDPRVIEAYLG